jgi:hypothetical protein
VFRGVSLNNATTAGSEGGGPIQQVIATTNTVRNMLFLSRMIPFIIVITYPN